MTFDNFYESPAPDHSAGIDFLLRAAEIRELKVKQRKNPKAGAAARESEVYKALFAALKRMKAVRPNEVMSGAFIYKALRAQPGFADCTTAQIAKPLKALVEDGVLRRVPPKPGDKYSSAYVFG